MTFRPLLMAVLAVWGASLWSDVQLRAQGAWEDRPSLSRETLLEKKLRPVITVLAEDDPPFTFRKNGKVTGFAADLVDEILRRHNRYEAIQIVPWKEGYARALKGPDTVLFTMMRTREREGKFKWVGPIFTSELVLLAKAGSVPRPLSLAEARKATVGTVQGWYSEDVLKREKFDKVRLYGAPREAVKGLLAGEVELLAITEFSGVASLKEQGGRLSDVEKVMTLESSPLYIAFSRDIDDESVEACQDTLEGIIRDGTAARIYRNWISQLYDEQ